MVKLRNTPLREAYEDLRWLESLLNNKDEKIRIAAQDMIERKKPRIRRNSRKGEDPLGKTISEDWRRVYGHDGETVLEYRIYPGNWDDVLDEEIEDEVRPLERHNLSPYDCTGKLCTAWLTWKRVKAGLSVCHCLCLDV